MKKFLFFIIFFASTTLYSYNLPDFLFNDNGTSVNTKNFEKPKVTIIIDDIGNSFEEAKKIWSINKNITLSILPFLKYSKKISIYAQKNNLPVMLHFPMEPYNYNGKPENYFLLTNMSDEEINITTKKVLNSIPYYQGINNHMGSKFTSNKKCMDKFFDIIKKKNIFFIDSKTSSNSIAGKISIEKGILTGIRDIFIDNILDEKYILSQLEKVYELAIKNKYVIAIGHPHSESISALKIFLDSHNNDLEIISAFDGLKKYKNYEKTHIYKREISN